jgi:formamidopyrimidine-DNA glycosylase
MTQMWGAMELYAQGEELKRQYIRDMRATPTDPAFTVDYLAALVADLRQSGKRTAKGLLTQEQLIPGLGNAIAQDILFRTGLHPKRLLADLKRSDIRKLHGAIVATINDVIANGGRNDEVDLHNAAGGYQRLMDKNAACHPCPKCGTKVEKMQYLGGACYFCPSCQR